MSHQSVRSVEVAAAPTAGPIARTSTPEQKATARICAIIVTWNRKGYLTTVLQALARQTYPIGLLDVVVIDNAGTDGTLDHLRATFIPERVVDNETEQAHEPNFACHRSAGASPATDADEQDAPAPVDRKADQPVARNSLGLSSLTVVRNKANMGGCGGFNTGFAFVEHWFGVPRAYQPVSSSSEPSAAPDFVWLVDDDVDLPPDALANLVKAMESDSKIGLVGSRTCDIADRTRTIETTIYYNAQTGVMQDDAPPGHARHDAHKDWITRVGGPRGQGGPHGYHGLMDVDVVSACSMLARWSAVVGESGMGLPTHVLQSESDAHTQAGKPVTRPGVGFWDHRYFIYCDDADWCLRFAKAGWRVVLNLDAVVFHTPWNLKLTPARIYYASRNRLWMAQKVLPTDRLRAVTHAAMKTILDDSLHAATHRRQFHARIILRTGLDAAGNVGGKTGSDGPPAVPTIEALRRAGCLSNGARVAVVCRQRESPLWLAELQRHVVKEITAAESPPHWLAIVRNDVPSAGVPADALHYGRHVGSRLKKQLWVLFKRPRAVVVFDQVNDFPVLFCAPWTLHIDHKKMESAQLERDGWAARIGFIFQWVKARFTMRRFARTVTPYVSETRYG